MGKTIDVIIKYDIYVQNHWCHIEYDIYGKIHRCHIKTRYLWDKPLMSYKSAISIGKTSRCHIKIRYLWGKQVDVI